MSVAARRALLAGVGMLAAAGGALWYVRRSGDRDVAAAPVDLWSQRFARPEGGELAMADLRGKPLLINFWATWCPPCVEELPLLNRFYAENKSSGWQLLGLAVDQVEPVKRFLTRTPLAFPIAMAGLAGVELTRKLGNTAGGLPFTVVFNARGELVQRKIGQVKAAELAAWRS